MSSGRGGSKSDPTQLSKGVSHGRLALFILKNNPEPLANDAF